MKSQKTTNPLKADWAHRSRIDVSFKQQKAKLGCVGLHGYSSCLSTKDVEYSRWDGKGIGGKGFM
jgi:hypothetical protein